MKRISGSLRKNIGLWIVIIGLIPAGSSTNLFAAGNASVAANQGVRLPQVAEDSVENKALGNANRPTTTSAPASGSTAKGFSNPITGTIWTALLFVLMIIFVAAWFIRKAYPGSPLLFAGLPVLQVLGRTMLGPKQALTLVRFDGRLLLLGITDHQINSVLTIDDPAEVSRLTAIIEQSRPSSITAGFKHFFSRETDQMQHSGETTPESPANSSKSLESSEENEVLYLKNELNSLINKVHKLKGIGSQNHSG